MKILRAILALPFVAAGIVLCVIGAVAFGGGSARKFWRNLCESIRNVERGRS